MSRSPDTLMDEACREARAETIRIETVIALRSEVAGDRPLTVAHATTIALQSLDRADMVLHMILADVKADMDLLARLDAHEARQAQLRFALRMRLGLVELGRAP